MNTFIVQEGEFHLTPVIGDFNGTDPHNRTIFKFTEEQSRNEVFQLTRNPNVKNYLSSMEYLESSSKSSRDVFESLISAENSIIPVIELQKIIINDTDPSEETNEINSETYFTPLVMLPTDPTDLPLDKDLGCAKMSREAVKYLELTKPFSNHTHEYNSAFETLDPEEVNFVLKHDKNVAYLDDLNDIDRNTNWIEYDKDITHDSRENPENNEFMQNFKFLRFVKGTAIKLIGLLILSEKSEKNYENIKIESQNVSSSSNPGENKNVFYRFSNNVLDDETKFDDLLQLLCHSEFEDRKRVQKSKCTSKNKAKEDRSKKSMKKIARRPTRLTFIDQMKSAKPAKSYVPIPTSIFDEKFMLPDSMFDLTLDFDFKTQKKTLKKKLEDYDNKMITELESNGTDHVKAIDKNSEKKAQQKYEEMLDFHNVKHSILFNHNHTVDYVNDAPDTVVNSVHLPQEEYDLSQMSNSHKTKLEAREVMTLFKNINVFGELEKFINNVGFPRLHNELIADMLSAYKLQADQLDVAFKKGRIQSQDKVKLKKICIISATMISYSQIFDKPFIANSRYSHHYDHNVCPFFQENNIEADNSSQPGCLSYVTSVISEILPQENVDEIRHTVKLALQNTLRNQAISKFVIESNQSRNSLDPSPSTIPTKVKANNSFDETSLIGVQTRLSGDNSEGPSPDPSPGPFIKVAHELNNSPSLEKTHSQLATADGKDTWQSVLKHVLDENQMILESTGNLKKDISNVFRTLPQPVQDDVRKVLEIMDQKPLEIFDKNLNFPFAQFIKTTSDNWKALMKKHVIRKMDCVSRANISVEENVKIKSLLIILAIKKLCEDEDIECNNMDGFIQGYIQVLRTNFASIT